MTTDMTKEEAIDLLDNLIGMVEDNHNSDYDTALKMAIKALEQEPNTDYVVGADSTGRFVKASEVFCDRNICLRNEYNDIRCGECEVTKSQEPKMDNDLDMKLKLMEANVNGYTQGLKDASISHKGG